MLIFPDVIDSIVGARGDLMTNKLCDYLYKLATTFTSFVTNCQSASGPIGAAGGEALHRLRAELQVALRYALSSLHLADVLCLTASCLPWAACLARQWLRKPQRCEPPLHHCPHSAVCSTLALTRSCTADCCYVKPQACLCASASNYLASSGSNKSSASSHSLSCARQLCPVQR